MNPYIMQMPQTQDLGGLNPVFQNMAAQQAMQNAALNQQNQLVQQAGYRPQGGMNPLAMAMMLRKGSTNFYETNPYENAQQAMNQYGASNVYGYGGQGQVPTMTSGMD